jgi:DNA-binding transcriptional LysR family regulator
MRTRLPYEGGGVPGAHPVGVSHIIAGLEEDFGFPLLVRSRLGAALTSDGERVMPLIRDILNGNEQLEQTAAAIRGLDTGSVSIGTFHQRCLHWLPGYDKRNFSSITPASSSILYKRRLLRRGQVALGGQRGYWVQTLPTDLKCECVPLLNDRILAVLTPDRSLTALTAFPEGHGKRTVT